MTKSRPTSLPMIWVAVLLFGGPWGCRAGPKEARSASLAGLEIGWSADRVDDYFTVRGAHQFTVRQDDREVLCLGYDQRFYCIFVDGVLDRVVRQPESETIRTWYEGAVWERPLPVDPEKRLRLTLDAPDLMGRVEYVYPPSTRRAAKKGFFSGQFGPAVLLIAPTYAAAMPQVFVGSTWAAGVSERFNGRTVRPGMNEAEIARVFGRPKFRRFETGGKLLCIYGQQTWVIDNTDGWFPWVCVELEDGRATRVFSHDFFNTRLLEQ